LSEKYLWRRTACAHCPVACIHLAALREPYANEPYFYKTTMTSYDYELLYSLGSMLGVDDTDAVLKLINEVEMWGLDAMMVGTVLSWMTEAFERGVINEDQIMGLRLRWGAYDEYAKAIRYIVTQPNDFYKIAAKGLQSLVDQYGGGDFALSYGGNGMPGYHTGPAAHLTYLTGARHSHLDSAGYNFDQEGLKKGLPSIKELATNLFLEESWRQILSSLVVCFFSRGLYTPQLVSEALKVAGYSLSEEDLNRLGEKILRNKNSFKKQEGFDMLALKFPRRIFELSTPHGMLDEKQLKEAVALYYSLLSST